jgi:hypothetical protein
MIFKFILLLVILNSLNSLESNDFCLLSQNESLICKHYQCSLDVCSKDKRSCDQLKNLHNNNQNYFNFFERMKKLLKISRETKVCRKSEYLSLSTHVCSISNKCNWTKQNMLGQLLKTTFVKTQKGCECQSRLKFHCGNNYCSVNKYTCNSIFNTKKNNDSNLKLIKYC